MSDIRNRIKLSIWKDKGDILKIAKAFDNYFDQVQSWLEELPGKMAAEVAPLPLLNLLAWGRDINRLPDETEERYRLRVKYALANAKDAGYKAGFERIWQRLGLGIIIQNERLDEVNWDVIELLMDEDLISFESPILNEIIRMYGRTCRRYTFSTITEVSADLLSFSFNHQTCFAKETVDLNVISAAIVSITSNQFYHSAEYHQVNINGALEAVTNVFKYTKRTQSPLEVFRYQKRTQTPLEVFKYQKRTQT